MLQAPAAPLPLCTAPVLSVLSFPGGRGSRGAVCLLSPWEQRRWLSLTGNVERLSAMYPKVSKAQNAELRLRWCQIVLRNNHEPEYSKVKAFLHSQVCAGGGRRGEGGRFCPSCSVLGVQCRAAPQPPLCRAGEAEVHTAAVPRHVGRLGGCPRVGHGDLLSHSPSAAHQRPQLRQEDPGLGGERLTAPAAPSPPSSAGCSALTARFLIKLGCFYPCVLLLFSAGFSVKPRYSRLCCCAGAWGCLHRTGLTAPTCTHLGLDVPCRTPSTAGMGAGALGKVPASAPTRHCQG